MLFLRQSLSLNSRSLPLFSNDVVCILSHSAPLSIALISQTKAVKRSGFDQGWEQRYSAGVQVARRQLDCMSIQQNTRSGFPTRACDLLSHRPDQFHSVRHIFPLWNQPQVQSEDSWLSSHSQGTLAPGVSRLEGYLQDICSRQSTAGTPRTLSGFNSQPWSEKPLFSWVMVNTEPYNWSKC